MTNTHVVTVAEKASNLAIYGGAAGSVASGGAAVFGLTSTQWSVVGIIGGLVISLIALLANVAITVYFKSQHLQIARRKADYGDGP